MINLDTKVHLMAACHMEVRFLALYYIEEFHYLLILNLAIPFPYYVPSYNPISYVPYVYPYGYGIHFEFYLLIYELLILFFFFFI